MIEYEHKFSVDYSLAQRIIESLPPQQSGGTEQVDLFPFGILSNGCMFRLRLETTYDDLGSYKDFKHKGLLTIKWWDASKNRVEYEFQVPATLVSFLLCVPYRNFKYTMRKTRWEVEEGVYLDLVDGISGFFMEVEAMVPDFLKNSKGQIDQHFKDTFKRITGKDGEFNDFSYSKRLFG